MPAIPTVENNFTKGLVTEFTGLNFPENAATDCDNCEFTLVGDVLRRQGVNREISGVTSAIPVFGAINSYKWNNAGGDGLTQVVVEQLGNKLYFYVSSNATVSAPLSTTLIASTVDIVSFVSAGGNYNPNLECQFSDGNGYLFVYHPNCDPFYCKYVTGSITATVIMVQTRDFNGVNDGLADTTRPATLSALHQYNLQNQGWLTQSAWGTSSTTLVPQSSLTSPTNVNNTFTVDAGLPAQPGDSVTLQATIFSSPSHVFIPDGRGIVVSYSGTTMVVSTEPLLSYTSTDDPTSEQWAITQRLAGGQIGSWQSQVGTYPSNSDVWWNYKDSTGTFNPTATFTNVTVGSPAPKGKYILNTFNQNRTALSGIGGLTTVSTTVRPRIGTWFQGRVWYAGADSSFASGGVNFTWTENIYFSQIVIGGVDTFGKCYQVNDPTSETLFDLLPTDGGVIQIQGCGSIYKLFPIQNGMLVFAANGVWFITGSQGIGFSATDYTITKISSVQSISSTSYVDVQGLPYFWNEEGIYAVQPQQGGSLAVNPLTVGTIQTFYDDIPASSKKYVRGAYHPIDYVIQWVYRSTDTSGASDAYTFDRILNYNTYNKAFFPYTVDTTAASIRGILYVTGPGGTNVPDPVFKYPMSNSSGASFADEHDTAYIDWGSQNFDSYFVTGYRVHGQGQRRFQIPYIYTYSRSDEPTSFKIQGVWDYALTGNSGRWSTAQLINNWGPNFGVLFRRHRIRGRGLVLQLKMTSVDGMPFDIIGWSTYETMNKSV